MIFSTSRGEIGLGRLRAPPTKPVTFAVFFTRCHVSSVISISTSTYPGKNRPLGHRFMAALYLNDFLGRNENLAELVLHASTVDALLKRTLHALLHAGSRRARRTNVFHSGIPAYRSYHFQPRIAEKIAHSMDLSQIQRNSAMTNTKPKTTSVVLTCLFTSRPDDLTDFLVRVLGECDKTLTGRREKTDCHAPPINPTAKAAPRTYHSWPLSQKNPTNPAKTNNTPTTSISLSPDVFTVSTEGFAITP